MILIYLKMYKIITGRLDDVSSKKQKSKMQIILPIKFNFTIHGVSGIKAGDTFNITDLPGVYKKEYSSYTNIT